MFSILILNSKLIGGITMKNIILIDDSVLLLEMIYGYLEQRCEKVKCIKFYNPFNALKYIADGNPVDVIVMDYHMPRINGIEMAYQVLENHKNIRIILQYT